METLEFITTATAVATACILNITSHLVYYRTYTAIIIIILPSHTYHCDYIIQKYLFSRKYVYSYKPTKYELKFWSSDNIYNMTASLIYSKKLP